MPPQGRISRRTLNALLIAVALGIFTTIGVAWTSACRPLMGGAHTGTMMVLSTEPPTPATFIDQLKFLGGERRGWYSDYLHLPYESHSDLNRLIIVAKPHSTQIIDRDTERSRLQIIDATWSKLSAAAHLRPNDGIEDARGWPLLALTCEFVRGTTGRWGLPYACRGGLQLPEPNYGSTMDGPITGPELGRALPLRPIWSGLLLNTLFYATLWSILLFIPRAIRRHYRAKHHRCPTCNYDLRNLPTTTCPECGTPS